MPWQRRTLVSLLSSYIPDAVQRRYVVERLLDGQVSLKEAGAREFRDLVLKNSPGRPTPEFIKFLETTMTEYVHSLNLKQDLHG